MNLKTLVISITILSVLSVSGCATVPKEPPKPTAGQVVGKVVGVGIDQAIRFTSKGIQAIINRSKNS